jgi:hypothetical protein
MIMEERDLLPRLKQGVHRGSKRYKMCYYRHIGLTNTFVPVLSQALRQLPDYTIGIRSAGIRVVSQIYSERRSVYKWQDTARKEQGGGYELALASSKRLLVNSTT